MKQGVVEDNVERTYVGLGEAAEVLGLSRTSLQKLVDVGQLEAVRTGGGHRRILRSSLLGYRERMATNGPRSQPARLAGLRSPREGRDSQFGVLLVDDDEVTIEVLLAIVRRHFPQSTCSVARDGMEAVVQIERHRPNVVITDLVMEQFDGFRLARHICGKPEYAEISVLAMTALPDEEVQRRGGLPPEVLLHRKPLNTQRVLGFLEAQAQFHRRIRGMAAA